jgi:hypothetical protein
MRGKEKFRFSGDTFAPNGNYSSCRIGVAYPLG